MHVKILKNRREIYKNILIYMKVAGLWVVLASIFFYRLSVISLLLTLLYFIKKEKSYSKESKSVLSYTWYLYLIMH